MDNLVLQIAKQYPELVESIIFKPNIKRLLIDTEYWPKAVEDQMIVAQSDEINVRRRALDIVRSYIPEPLEGKKFLDFGTGYSECWKYAKHAAFTMGYDIDEGTDACHDWAAILECRPFDVILVYDVIDHLVDLDGKLMEIDQIKEVLRYLKDLLTADGRIYMRCHPWASRHGTHAYLNCNKAFVHYETREFDQAPTHQFYLSYRELFDATGLQIVSMKETNQDVEQIFLTTPFLDWKSAFTLGDRDNHDKLMQCNFVDYILA
jgi:hypothetical protein